MLRHATTCYGMLGHARAYAILHHAMEVSDPEYSYAGEAAEDRAVAGAYGNITGDVEALPVAEGGSNSKG